MGKSLLLPEGGRASAAPSPVKAMRPATDADATPERAMITGDPSRCLMRAGVIGVIERMPKKEHSGVIRIVSDISRLAELDFTDVLHKDIINALYEFMALDEWKEVTMEHVGSRTRKTMHTIIKLVPKTLQSPILFRCNSTIQHRNSLVWRMKQSRTLVKIRLVMNRARL